MAGSFGVFRQYEKAALAALAIMAMLAFFVLPPILQMGGGGSGGPDPMVVSWTGGGLRESGVQRAVIMRKVMNQFLVTTMAASGQDPSRMRLADDEKDVVDTLLLAREAEANGIVISNSAINQFLAEWTNDLVPPKDFDAIVAGIGGRMGISQEDVFEALRTVLMARRMETLLLGGVGFEAAPPGVRWDYYRRLEQGATIEAIPVVAETFVDQLPEPAEPVLRAFFDAHRDELPAARSPAPGFRQPHRARYDYLVAKAGGFRDEEEKKMTAEQITAFYEDRKASLFRVKPAETPELGVAKPEPETMQAAEAENDATKPSAEPPAEASEEKPVAAPAGVKDGSRVTRGAARQVAFRQPESATTEAPKPATGEAVKEAAAPAAPNPVASGSATPAATSAAAGVATTPDTADAPATAPATTDAPAQQAEFEPLDKVRDDIVKRLTDEAVDKRISAIFDAVKTDVAKYGESLALWQVAGDGAGPAPSPPDVKKIAAAQGLEGGTSDLLNATQAVAAGGIGGSFELAASRELGMRQQRWIDTIFGGGSQMLQAVTTRDIDGNRYVSWKTEDQPEFTPSFQSAREDVLRAWRIVEARPLARKAAEELVAAAKEGTTLEAVAASRGGLEVEKVGPFNWLTRGTAPFGSAPELSQPDGLAMPGEELMQAVFALEPGQSTVAFNEPKTVCYAIRLGSFEPDEAQLKELFIAAAKDPRRLAAVAEGDTRQVYDRWLESIEKRHAVSWKREPRGPELQ